MPTIAEGWIKEGFEKGTREGMQQGMLEGLLEGIELGLQLKFGTKGIRLMPMIRKIKDPDRLRAVTEGIKVAARISEIENLIAT